MQQSGASQLRPAPPLVAPLPPVAAGRSASPSARPSAPNRLEPPRNRAAVRALGAGRLCRSMRPPVVSVRPRQPCARSPAGQARAGAPTQANGNFRAKANSIGAAAHLRSSCRPTRHSRPLVQPAGGVARRPLWIGALGAARSGQPEARLDGLSGRLGSLATMAAAAAAAAAEDEEEKRRRGKEGSRRACLTAAAAAASAARASATEAPAVAL